MISCYDFDLEGDRNLQKRCIYWDIVKWRRERDSNPRYDTLSRIEVRPFSRLQMIF
jgi:hypothetical protein